MWSLTRWSARALSALQASHEKVGPPHVLPFSSAQSLRRVWPFVTPWTIARQPPLSFTISWSLNKFMSIESVMLSNLILCRSFSFCHQSFPASRPFPVSQLFTSGSQSIGASASVLPMNIQGWRPVGLTGLILQPKGLSRVFSGTTIGKHQFFSSQPFIWPSPHIHTWLLEKP